MTKPKTTAPDKPSSGVTWVEAAITINGHALTLGQSMTVRVAIESMAGTLAETGLGDDDHGRAMVAAYQARINEIREMIDNVR